MSEITTAISKGQFAKMYNISTRTFRAWSIRYKFDALFEGYVQKKIFTPYEAKKIIEIVGTPKL